MKLDRQIVDDFWVAAPIWIAGFFRRSSRENACFDLSDVQTRQSEIGQLCRTDYPNGTGICSL